MGRRPHPKSQQGQKSAFPRLYGRHAVFAALDNPERALRKLIVTHASAQTIVIPPGLTVQYGDDHDLGRLVPTDAPHQGFVLEVEPLESPWLGDLLADAVADNDKRPLMVLDQVTDPHNVGAIMRSALAFGARALVTQDRHSPQENGALARAASGALEALPWCRVVNLARALDEIGEAGFWRIGLDGSAEADLESALGDTRPALVMGAEGEGLRALTIERCDQMARLPISAAMESLNVSNAAAIALYAAARRG
ncbi:23S rRNA (guanosine(2251)-2'-O)-methyltransferase RlmB [Polymorphobacter multimanifer]|uniref:23S rRNA (Guanosine2251-2'-O)-methyltransferase n=1 Tax=Polymorphobacter multimanifer TaxID=1070431 RepID=A0A841LB66_9SPHN|nr:23S rRNA (guanosine(2251)-2'-O)-methyltransferase RlmB [Polymorphobacter multimanifer]MBB6228901.1 23S rRNA (guanosine2251-2'-O)-methyltransferase [Polymorphobacter multimanifer]GGI85972.1 23S rRNA (guanosine(2251)-2'-O)-methyltransferase RlmB [Polymorphobacter multimanifer]